jgi:hypothetical protein
MQSLNSVGYARKATLVTGIGMLIAFLFLVPFAAFAASTVTVTTNKPFYAGTATMTVSGTITPSPGVNGTSVAVTITGKGLAQIKTWPVQSRLGDQRVGVTRSATRPEKTDGSARSSWGLGPRKR